MLKNYNGRSRGLCKFLEASAERDKYIMVYNMVNMTDKLS